MERLHLTKPRYELWILPHSRYRVYVTDYRLANRLNALTGHYGDYKLKEGEEAQFYLNASQLGALGLTESYISSLPRLS